MSEQVDDILAFAAPKSDQINADDLLGGARVYRIIGTRPGPEGRLDVRLEGEERVWRPCKTMTRVLAAVWGARPSAWPQPALVRLYRDPEVRFGGESVGGIRIEAMSGIEAPQRVGVVVKKGKRGIWTVQPLEVAKPATLAEVLADIECSLVDLDAWRAANGKPPVSELTDEQRQQLAAAIAASPKLVAAIRGARGEG